MAEPMRVVQLGVVGDHRLALTFTPARVAELSFEGRTWEDHEELGDPEYFAKVKIDVNTGGLVWPNGYTIGPDDLYAKVNESSAPNKDSNSSSGGPTLVTVAGAVASGLGVLGFVAFAGGVVLWTRFKGMGLPADHALALVPKPELVATGADFLVPALLLSAAIVLIVILIDLLSDHSTSARKLIAPLLIGSVGVYLSLETLAVVPVSALILLLGVTVLGSLCVNACANFSLAAFCLIAFLAIGTFAIARTYERTSHALTVIPMAYSRAQPGEAPRVEIGYFVAETSDRIFFASSPEEGQNELREFPRNETDDLEVGALASPRQAEQSAARFAYNLCERLRGLRAVAPHPAVAPVCADSYVEELKAKAKLISTG
jgi:hypothetical protein